MGAPAEEDLQSWAQHSCTDTVPDDVMRYIGRALPGAVSFVFSCQARRAHVEQSCQTCHSSTDFNACRMRLHSAMNLVRDMAQPPHLK